ncbi:MAG: MOSC domain-containing protein [Bdellovibrionota bacterium]
MEPTLELIVRRPTVGEREILEEGQLDLAQGLVGDGWLNRGSKRTPDGRADVFKQITIISTLALREIEPDPARWPLAGDQLYVSMDLGENELPVGSHLCIGEAVLQITEPPHTGCDKFAARFGREALVRFSTSDARRARKRGVHAKVTRPGRIRRGDHVSNVTAPFFF